MKIKSANKFILVTLTVANCFCALSNGSVSIPADYTGDQKVDLADFAVLSAGWLDSVDTEQLDRFFFHWLMDAGIEPDLSVQKIYTDKSRYLPGQQSIFAVNCKNNSDSLYQGRLSLNITHHGHSMYTERQDVSIMPFQTVTRNFSWTPTETDFTGYLVEAWLDNGSFAVTAIDISSDWKRFPRYGYITEFYSGQSPDRNTEMINQLSRDYHINSLQYYDWMWRHENVIQRVGDTIVDPWIDWRGASISFNVLQDSIYKADVKRITALPYFQIYLGLDDYETISGVNPQWGLYSDTSHSDQYFHDAGVNMWVFNPGDVNWQNHLCDQYTDALLTMDWDGIHLDQLGNIGSFTYYDYWGVDVDLVRAYGSMLNRTKDHLDYLESLHPQVEGRDGFLFNIVDGGVGNWGVDEVLASKVDVIYSELWSTETYSGVHDFIRYARANSGNKAIVLAAYINRFEDTGGFFDPDTVLLADAAFFASGGFHLELGDGEYMLSQEFFPARDKLIPENLKPRLKDYYNFITAYESLLFAPGLRFGDTGLQWISTTGYNLSGNGSADTIWFLNRGTNTYEIFHLINLLGNDDQWRNIAGSPPLLENIPIKLRLGPDADIEGVYVASADNNSSIMLPIPYTLGTDSQGDYLLITLPHLEYWDMIYIERTIKAPGNNRYEAEDAIKWNVGVNTNHGGYSGSGFVDQFAEINDSVSFYVAITQPGDYSFSFRYANGGSDASRALFVNGDYKDDIEFGALGNWEFWNTEVKQLYMEPGIHQVVLYYGSWNNGAINLDYLQIQ
jgi:dextranase